MQVIRVLSLSLVLCFVFMACAASGKDVVLGQEERGKVVNVSVGDTVKILLPSNPTTGYGWQFFIEDGQGNVDILKDAFIPPKYDGRVGVGGEHVYELRAVSTGKAKVAGYYYRPWEGLDKDKDTNVIYEIVIR